MSMYVLSVLDIVISIKYQDTSIKIIVSSIKRYALMTNLFMKCKRKKNRMFFGVSPIVLLIS